MTAEITVLQAPFPWFGGKSRAAALIWSRLGRVQNLVDSFFGSGAVLLGNPDPPPIETVNDRDGLVANFWRALRADPAAVAYWADQPVVENDLHARHAWLLGQLADLVPRLEGDPDFYDAKIAGWWVWGLCCWIGSGWCSGRGPWSVVEGRLVKGSAGQGVNRKLPHLGDAGQGVNRKLENIGGHQGFGVNRSQPPGGNLLTWFEALAARLARVRVCCGDWTRVMGPSVTTKLGLTGVVLDPPYAETERESGLYRQEGEGRDLPGECRAWCLAHGDDPLLRIALCGYDVEHVELEAHGWTVVEWVAKGSYIGKAAGGQADTNRRRERIWFSPHCLRPERSAQIGLFGEAGQ